jgi:hypothetical protein
MGRRTHGKVGRSIHSKVGKIKEMKGRKREARLERPMHLDERAADRLRRALPPLRPRLADEVSKAAPSAVYGTILIVVALVMPRGIAGMIQRLTRAIVGRLRPGHRTPSKEEP